MTQEEILKQMVPGINDDDIVVLLELSKGVILNARYPFEDTAIKEVEDRYKMLQVQMCIEMYNRRGSEGETQRTENGISRTYDSAEISKALIDKITPKALIL